MTVVEEPAAGVPLAVVSREEIEEKVRQCPRLPSLRSVDSALRELLNADHRYTSYVAEVIRRDPSLTARLLRLVNSVYYGLTSPVNSIEEAVFFLGIRQIRQLAMMTPVIEDFQKLAGHTAFPWREFWRHCIATAILSQELSGTVRSLPDETPYVAGLVHDVGKIVMASAFPAHFAEIQRVAAEGEGDLLETERAVLGMPHTEIGAVYLKHHHLPAVLVDASLCHHAPECAESDVPMIAVVRLANQLSHAARIGMSGNPAVVNESDWLADPSWELVFPAGQEEERTLARAALRRKLEHLPLMLEKMI
ncbi:MAG: HDOD domain-containing protein [Limisphaerales bacterium]